MKKNYHIEIRAMDNIPMMIRTKKLNYWKKCHSTNMPYILERTIDGRLYSGPKTCKDDKYSFQTYILAVRECFEELLRLDFKVADVASCGEILEYHDRQVEKYGLYGGKKNGKNKKKRIR